MSKKSFIDSVRVDAPCSEDWDQMSGNDRVRFCSHCSKHVNNLSEMTRKEAVRLVRASDGKLCIRYITDPKTNQPLFGDQLFRIARRTPKIAAGVMTASLTLSTLTYAQEESPSARPTTAPVAETTVDSSAEVDGDADASNETQLGTIDGSIWDSRGKPVGMVELMLVESGSGHVDYAETDHAGHYGFAKLGSGAYFLRINTISGYRKAAPAIEIADGQTVVQNFHVAVVEPSEERVEGWGSGGAMAMMPYTLPLSHAVSENDISTVREMLSRGIDPNGRDTNYEDITPLFLAVENGNLEIAKLLIEHGANVDATDKQGRTPLMFLDDDADTELVSMLLRLGANVLARDNDGNGVLLQTIRSIKVDVLKALLDSGADVNLTDSDNETALMIAAEQNKLDIVEQLVLAGADVNARNKLGETAWDKTSKLPVEQYLEDHGAVVDYGNIVVERVPEPDNGKDKRR